jgi:hypothetical protein
MMVPGVIFVAPAWRTVAQSHAEHTDNSEGTGDELGSIRQKHVDGARGGGHGSLSGLVGLVASERNTRGMTRDVRHE